MKKIILLASAIFLSSITYAQSASQVGWVSKFGLAGGFTPIYIMPDLSVVNSAFSFDTDGMLAYGGGGYAYVMFIDNLRLGGMGFSGSRSESRGINEVGYTIGGGGLTIEYTLPFIKRIAVSPGLILGGGSIELEVSRNSGNLTWDDVWNDFSNANSNTENLTRKLTNSYYIVSPTLNVDIPFNRFLAFRIGAGYQMTFDEEWTVDNNQDISGVPSDLNGNSFFIQAGLFVGFFAF